MSKLNEVTESKQQLELSNTTDKNNSNFEILKLKHLENSPFSVLEIAEHGFCGVIGDKRITEFKETFSEAEEEVLEINWNRLIQVIFAINEKFNKINVTNEQ